MPQDHQDPPDRPEYRVVYRDGGTVRGLGRLAGGAPTLQALDPFLSRLLLAGVDRGELLLVEAGSRRVAARRVVRPRRRRS